MRATRLALAAVLASVLLAACGGGDSEPAGDAIVMTRNLYLGAPIEPVLALTSPDAIPGEALRLWNTVVASDIPGRARAVAAEIAALQPDLVGLQEATLWRTQSPADPLSAATHVEYDFVTLIVDELAARGLRYDPVAVSLNFDAELPASDGNPLTAIDVRMTDRDVILARSGVPVRDAADGRYTARVGFDLAGTIPLSIPRGWTSVVATVAGGTFRFVNTHLEIGTFEPIQVLQAQELTGVLASSALPTIVVGDLNSNAIAGGGDNTPSYGIVTGAGFNDLWATLHPAEPGLTCCQDGSLRNTTSTLFERIDLILHRGGFQPSSADVVGEAPADRTASGLWPSDHAGVVGALRPPR
ncbi:MAG TPA: endonuclease/exonuclease/phosphatase family protein [Anaeromyxobacteraceae bacterium]|nr:endonuclease/exonuclease/phosphatase family protein [Anaeromyxobacteraceae bacterium]